MSEERLTRDLDHAMIGGVLAGLASRATIDVTLLRLIAIVSVVATGGLTVPLYVAAWLIIPRPDQLDEHPGIRQRLRPGEIGASVREAGDATRRAVERINEAAHLASEAARTAADAARTAADAARTAAEEFSDIAHHAAPADGPGASEDVAGGESPGAASAEPSEEETRPWTATSS